MTSGDSRLLGPFVPRLLVRCGSQELHPPAVALHLHNVRLLPRFLQLLAVSFHLRLAHKKGRLCCLCSRFVAFRRPRSRRGPFLRGFRQQGHQGMIHYRPAREIRDPGLVGHLQNGTENGRICGLHGLKPSKTPGFCKARRPPERIPCAEAWLRRP